MTARITPVAPPYAPDLQAAFDKSTPPGVPPLLLFTTLARDERLFARLRGGALLDPGQLTLRQREIIVGRTTALSGSDYEWGVHVHFFAERAGLDKVQQRSLACGSDDDACWSPEDRLLIRASEALHATCNLDDDLWNELRASFSEEGLMEVMMLAGFYRMVSYLTNGLRLPPETYAPSVPTQRS